MDGIKIRQLLEQYPFVSAYFEDNQLNIEGFEEQSFEEYLAHFSEEEIEDLALDIEGLREGLAEYISQM